MKQFLSRVRQVLHSGSAPAQASALPTKLDLVLSLSSLGWALCRVR